MKQKILILLSIFAIIVLFLKFKFGIMHKYTIINILAILSFIAITIFNIMYASKSKKIYKIFHIIFSTILIISLLYLIFIIIINTIFGVRKTIDSYAFPNKESEILKNVYFTDTESISVPIELVYEKEFILGIKCSVTIKINSDNTDTYDLKKEYSELKNTDNKGFCNYKLNYYRVNMN